MIVKKIFRYSYSTTEEAINTQISVTRKSKLYTLHCAQAKVHLKESMAPFHKIAWLETCYLQQAYWL